MATQTRWANAGWRTKQRLGGGALVVPDAAALRVWLDGDDIDGAGNTTLTNGVTFSAWTNKGTLGGTMDQATPANQPTYRTGVGPGGARPAADFDGADFMTSSLAASNFIFLHDGNGATIYTVAKTSVSGVQTIVATCNGGGTAIGVIHRYNTGFAASYAMNDGVALRIAVNGAAATVTNGSFDVMASTLASADTPDLSIYVNGTSRAIANSAGFAATDPAATLTLGATPSATFPLNGPLYQTLIYAGSHDTATRAAVLAFLVAKAGVASYPVA